MKSDINWLTAGFVAVTVFSIFAALLLADRVSDLQSNIANLANSIEAQKEEAR